MTLRIYGNSANMRHPVPNMFFDLNGQDYIFDTVPQDILYDINCNGTIDYRTDLFEDVKSRIKLLLFLYDDKENLLYELFNDYNFKDVIKNNFYMLTTQNGEIINEYPNLIYVDFWFNIVKSYYSNYPYKPDTKKWFYHNEHSYILYDIPYSETKTRIFVAPNRVYNDEWRVTKYRKILVLNLRNKKNLGHIGSSTLNKSWVLYPHGDYPNINNINSLLAISEPRKEKWGYAPIHWEYLKDTFISIYTETIEYGNEYFISEKTYDPLTRGHFILPFSNFGFIKRLKKLGYKFPKFIDYSYDEILDDDKRWSAYYGEVDRLLNTSIDDWKQYWDDNIEILKHNRQLMLTRPYDRFDLKSIL